jgi:hypothetical protein
MADASKHQDVREREKTSGMPLHETPGASANRDTFAFPRRGTFCCPARQDATQSPGKLRR